jgi:hypothetical protein
VQPKVARAFADGASVGRALDGPPGPEGGRVSRWEARERERGAYWRRGVIEGRNGREKEGRKGRKARKGRVGGAPRCVACEGMESGVPFRERTSSACPEWRKRRSWQHCQGAAAWCSAAPSYRCRLWLSCLEGFRVWEEGTEGEI